MGKSVEFCQMVARSITATTWNIPRIRDRTRWRNIKYANLVMNESHINGHDRFEDAVFRLEKFMRCRGWQTEITDTKQHCHEHLYYQHYRLTCWK